MRKAIYIGLIILSSVLTSCGKKSFEVAPINAEANSSGIESIKFNGVSLSKSSDAFSIGKTSNTATSSFITNSINGQANIKFEVLNTFASQSYDLNSQNVSVELTSNSMLWSTKLGHQKGAKFEIIKSENLDANTGYVKEVTIKTSCFLYNNEGAFKPFICLTKLKY